MQVHNFTFRVRQGEFGDAVEDERPYTEAGDMGLRPLWLGFTKRSGSFYVELTGMTSEELELFTQGMLAALDAAKEVVAWLDVNADYEYNDDTPMVPLRALKGTPAHVIREIRPFIGTERDPIETKDDEKAYEQAVQNPLGEIAI
jgi:hypothetical protein